jgi:DNA primase
MIPDEDVERVREGADIVSIIGEYVKLKRSGNSFRGPCPFHQGTHNNFSVTPRGGYSCFVCGEKGDVFTFVQKHLGLDFVGAVKLVGEKSGIEVREVAGRHAEERDPREPFWEINNAATDFFESQLVDPAVGADARKYLESRGLTIEDARRFKIGFAPRSDALWQHLTALGFSDQRQLDAGLLVLPEGKTRTLVRFRNRLIFPITDAAGNVVGFGGRLLGPGEPKYLNSPDSVHFSKRTLLYGMHSAKNAIRKTDRVLIVEGYFDAIRLALAGIDEVVAPMGTALTRDQATLVKKHTHNVFLVYDSDSAGLRATFRSGDVLLATGIAPRVVSLPEGDDPDTFTAKHGLTGINREINQSIDVFDRKVQILERSAFFSDVRRKREAIDKLLATIRLTADPLSRALYISRAAEASGLSPATLEQEVAQLISADAQKGGATLPSEPYRHQQGKTSRVEFRPARKISFNYPPEGYLKEHALVRTLLHRRDLVYTASRALDLDHFRDPVHRRIMEALFENPEVSVDEIAAGMDEKATEVLQELITGGQGLNHEAVVRGGINSLLARDVYDEGTRTQDALKMVAEKLKMFEELRLLDDKSARARKKVIELWERVGGAPSDGDHVTVDSLLAQMTLLLDKRWRKVKEWLSYGIPKYRNFAYPILQNLTDFVESLDPRQEVDPDSWRRVVGSTA